MCKNNKAVPHILAEILSLFFVGLEFFQPVPESPGAEQKSSRLEYTVNTKNMDPAKAKQAERLGMGGMGSRAVGHSASANMGTIDQVGPSKTHGARMDRIANPPQRSTYDRYHVPLSAPPPTVCGYPHLPSIIQCGICCTEPM